jgi:hypothetical protein
VYANVTVYFPEQYEFVVAMERFEDKLKSVDCSEDMMIEFVDKATFDHVKSSWNWVSDDVNNTFVMVTNHAKCADDMVCTTAVANRMELEPNGLSVHHTSLLISHV